MLKNRNFRLLCLILVVAALMADMTVSVRAEATVYDTPKQGIVIYADTRVRTGPSTSKAQLTIDGVLQYYTYYQQLTVLGEDHDASGDLWYQVKVTLQGKEYTTWIYGEYLEIINNEIDESYKTELLAQGFPEDYCTYLLQLHALHPNWKFVAYSTGLEWDTVIAKESVLGKNLIDGSNTAYRSTAEGAFNKTTQKYIALDGSSWYAANSQTIAYYIDPRNFLNTINIFMFLKLSYSADITEEVVQPLLSGTFMAGKDPVDDKTYASLFTAAAKNANVNAVYLAALALQEQGTTGSKAITGAAFTYNNVTYSGLYNFFNIGATSGTDNWKKGLVYANGGATDDGSIGSATTNGRPWTSPAKSINGGALFVSDSYINAGQDTMYLQKFNVTLKSTYSHQYMTNVRAAYSQSKSIYATFSETNLLDGSLTFVIPVFKNMPTATSLPTTTTLPPADKEETEITYTGDFIKDLNLEITNGYIHGFALGTTIKEVKDTFGKLTTDKVTVTMTATDGSALADSALLATGQIMQVVDESGTSTYTYVMYGDVNGDGKIGLIDNLMVKKHILETDMLSAAYAEAAMINGEITISLRSNLYIKKYILGSGDIDQ